MSPWSLSHSLSLRSLQGPEKERGFLRLPAAPTHSLEQGQRLWGWDVVGAANASSWPPSRDGRRGNFPEDLGSPLRKQEPPPPKGPLQVLKKAGGSGGGSRTEGIPPGPGRVGGGCQSSRRARRFLFWTAWLRSCATPSPNPASASAFASVQWQLVSKASDSHRPVSCVGRRAVGLAAGVASDSASLCRR